MKTALFDYNLPESFIAQKPAEPRDSAKLMVLNRNKKTVKHKIFLNIVDYLKPGDCLVVNQTKVIPARLKGQKADTGAKIELLLLRKRDSAWEALAKGARKLKQGSEIEFKNFKVTVTDKREGGLVRIVSNEKIEDLMRLAGDLPLPPYIKNYKGPPERYQTVYAKEKGSVAAPTAGLHFTEGLLRAIKEKGVNIASVNLHVSWDTFMPVRENEIENHKIHNEHFSVGDQAVEAINKAKASGKKVVAVGTTVVRTLESASENNTVKPAVGETSLYIYPGHSFKIVDAVITNFHLPKSTLLMLVSAFAGREFLLEAYGEAKKNNYRFFSFGDAMLII